jgi:hypothetical protein
MCSTCTHRPLCRFAELFSCHKSTALEHKKIPNFAIDIAPR